MIRYSDAKAVNAEVNALPYAVTPISTASPTIGTL